MGIPRQAHWAILVVAVLVLVVLPIGAAYRALHSESALQWALAQLSRVPNIRIEAAGASGTLAGPLTIERLVIDHEAARIEARGVRLDARMRSLLAGNVHLEQAKVERLDVVLKEREEQPPERVRKQILGVAARWLAHRKRTEEILRRSSHLYSRGDPLGLLALLNDSSAIETHLRNIAGQTDLKSPRGPHAGAP